jgi:tRNA G37 N-methylase TrmD
MLDALLRYIAGYVNQNTILNHSINPSLSGLHYSHYPSPNDILALERQQILTPCEHSSLSLAMKRQELTSVKQQHWQQIS